MKQVTDILREIEGENRQKALDQIKAYVEGVYQRIIWKKCKDCGQTFSERGMVGDRCIECDSKKDKINMQGCYSDRIFDHIFYYIEKHQWKVFSVIVGYVTGLVIFAVQSLFWGMKK